MNQWYYAKNGGQNGPVTIEELQALLRSGAVGGGDLVWNPTMKDWLPASSVAEVSGALISQGAANPYAPPSTIAAVPVVPVTLPEIEPGSEPIRIMECIQRGFDLTKRQFLVLFLGLLIIIGISIAISMPLSIAQGFRQATDPQAFVPPAHLAGDPFAAFQWGLRSQFSVLYFINQVVSLVAMSFLMAGYYRISLNVASGLPASPGQLFGQGGKLARVIGFSVLLSLPQWIGFAALAFLPIAMGGTVLFVAMLVGIVLWLRLGYAGMAVVDRDLSLADGLKYSFSITRNNSLRIFGLGFLTSLIAVAGAIVCLVGMFFTVPVALMGVTVAYRWLQYGRGVVADPVPVG